MALALTCPPPLLSGKVGFLASQSYPATGGTPPYTWSLSDGLPLPAGMALDPATGVISGVPTVAGLVFFHLLVTDSLGAIAGCFLGEGGVPNAALIAAANICLLEHDATT